MWAAGLAEPSEHLVGLFPGIAGNGSNSAQKEEKDQDDMEE